MLKVRSVIASLAVGVALFPSYASAEMSEAAVAKFMNEVEKADGCKNQPGSISLIGTGQGNPANIAVIYYSLNGACFGDAKGGWMRATCEKISGGRWLCAKARVNYVTLFTE